VARDKADLEATARELAAETNRRIVPLAADVTSKHQVGRMVAEAAEQLGGLHILVNSGSAPGGSATARRPNRNRCRRGSDRGFNVKYVGALRCSRAIIPLMKKEGWGRIINISGGNARNAGNLSGGARNASLVHMKKTLAVQLGRHGITVNCIHPRTTRTERTPSLLAARAKQLGVSPEEAELSVIVRVKRAPARGLKQDEATSVHLEPRIERIKRGLEHIGARGALLRAKYRKRRRPRFSCASSPLLDNFRAPGRPPSAKPSSLDPANGSTANSPCPPYRDLGLARPSTGPGRRLPWV
jgi:NAD(P)-dependent dehydrogenase (short-subunit alcohol dehydrogenase family)